MTVFCVCCLVCPHEDRGMSHKERILPPTLVFCLSNVFLCCIVFGYVCAGAHLLFHSLYAFACVVSSYMNCLFLVALCII